LTFPRWAGPVCSWFWSGSTTIVVVEPLQKRRFGMVGFLRAV
jgi:hypothetical protein